MAVLKFFFDACMSARLAAMTQIFEGDRSEVIHHDQMFPRSTPDEVWIKQLALNDPKWVVICGDSAILRNKAEKAALWTANLTFFRMQKQWPQMDINDQVWKFFRVWPHIVSSADVSPPKQFDVQVGEKPKVIVVGPTRF